ncbi:hypothetical protein N1851_015948 [Merluccius polli]|uniref:Uncharacterized protein n=1 Tax=Merluccius polli TaxID=89951 RepID=A0AA47MS92_MERPO|nr:hypothetical protein N1851_015948 [Merluccius polli]
MYAILDEQSNGSLVWSEFFNVFKISGYFYLHSSSATKFLKTAHLKRITDKIPLLYPDAKIIL